MTPDFYRPVLDGAQLSSTADSIEACQLPNGMIQWFEGGHADPWNHVEAAMALAVAGRLSAAEKAYEWLRSAQLPDGAWFNYYLPDGSVEDPKRDTNVCAYIATGIWHHYLVTGDAGFIEDLWEVLEAAVGFVLSWQQPGGELIWSVDPDGTPGDYALLTGSSSAYFSLRCAVACAERIGREQPDWELAAGRLRHAVAYKPGCFEPKERYAMDWYYPVLSGALDTARGAERIDERWSELVIEGRGVRCVADKSWVTAAETAECAMALMSLGRMQQAAQLLDWVQDQRNPDGSYMTGYVYPQRSSFPTGEASTYTGAAMILAVDTFGGTGPASGLFLGRSLPTGAVLDLDAEAVEVEGGA
ncbi:MAG: prenyltransferase [Acidimicrobiales bacterium]